MAAEAATPGEHRLLPGAHLGGDLRPRAARAGRRARPAADGHGNTEAQRTAFTVSVDAGTGTTTGISATDRAATIAALIDPATRPGDLNRPGHIFPLRYRTGRCAEAGRAHRGGGRPGPRRRPDAGRRALRDRHRGQVVDGPAARARALRQAARPPAHLHRRPHPVPAPEREAGPRASPRPASRRAAGEFRAYVYESVLDGEQHLALVHGRGRRSPRTCWCGSTPSA